MEFKDLESYNIINASESELLVNWPFNSEVTFRFLIFGGKSSSLKNFIIERYLLDYFFFIEENVYFFFPPKNVLKLTAISYPNLVACGIYHALLDLEKQKVIEVSYGSWGDVLENLLSPLVHYQTLNTLKKHKFFEKHSLVIIKSFIFRIERLNRSTYNNYFSFHPESKNADFVYNILTFLGIDNKEALTLAENCIVNNNLNEIKEHLQSLYDKKKQILKIMSF